ncbi:uncharacterized protein [Bemisia tabaci]|uniref:uncharacterized protein n=1 Tax=Bemisia tabaci TaxID=7038 RepID=UPI003B28A282
MIFDEILNLNTTPDSLKQAYADDTLLIITGVNEEEIKTKTKQITKQIKEKLRKKKLLTEDNKTEAILLHGPRKAENIEVTVGEAQITAGTSLTSLGFQITRGVRMAKHIKAACEKARKVATHFRPLLPNLHGPTFIRRKIMIQAVMSIIFYGVIIWAPDCNLKKNKEEIRKTLRPLKLALCSAYRTTSDFALNIISGIPSETILIQERMSKYMKEDPIEIHKDKMTRWEIEWSNSPNKWTKRVIPELHKWLNRRHGQPDFYLTQFLSSHGAYASYLHRFKKRKDPYCPYCIKDGIEIKDTPEHTFFTCNNVRQKKEELEKTLNIPTLTPDNLIPTMLDSRKKWTLIHAYVKNTLQGKQHALNQEKDDDSCQPSSSPEDRPPQGNSGTNKNN